MTRRHFLAGGLLVLALAVAPAAPPHDEKEHAVFTPDSLKWVDGPPSLPAGCKMVVLEGDPTKAGPFVMRAKMPAGYKIMPHTHPQDEHVTVLSGALYLGVGGTFDEKAAAAMPAGSYGRMPAGMKHFGYTKAETVIQLHGTGPWAVVYVNPADDPRAKK